MVVTVNTDASYCPHNKVGGFAFWIKCDLGTITRSGPIKCAENSLDCEIKALANAVYCLEKSAFNQGKITMVIINSDCTFMFPYIGKKSNNEAGKLIARQLSWIRQKNPDVKATRKFYSLRHVKAHNGTPDARSWVNDWCDKQAKLCMNLERERVKKEKSEQLHPSMQMT